MRLRRRSIVQMILICVIFTGCIMAMNSYVHAFVKKNQNIYIVNTKQIPILDSQWGENEERTILVEKYMRELGFEEEEIDDVSTILNEGASLHASIFSSSMSVWIFLAIAEMVAIICMVLFIIKNVGRRD